MGALHMLPTIILSQKWIQAAFHRTLALCNSAEILLCLVVTGVDVTIEMAFCCVSAGTVRALEGARVRFAVVARRREWGVSTESGEGQGERGKERGDGRGRTCNLVLRGRFWCMMARCIR